MTTRRRESATGSAEERIKQFILAHHLAPGDPLPTELELCDQLGVSRSSVREAIRTLSALEMVDVRHGTGTFVGHLSMTPLVKSLVFRGMLAPREAKQALTDIIEVRTALDLGQSEQVVAKLKGHPQPGLEALVAEMVALSERSEEFPDQDRAFHGQLLACTPNQLMSTLVEAFWDVHSQLLTNLDVPTPADITETARAHGDMLAAAKAGDLSAYRAAVRAHYAPLLRVLDRVPDQALDAAAEPDTHQTPKSARPN